MSQPVLLNHPMSGVRLGRLISTYLKDEREIYVLDMGKFVVNYATRDGFKILTEDEAEALGGIKETSVKSPKGERASKKPKAQRIPSVGQKKCACSEGCTEFTGGTFAPGHDMKAKAVLNRMLTGEEGIISQPLKDYIQKKSQWRIKYGSLI